MSRLATLSAILASCLVETYAPDLSPYISDMLADLNRRCDFYQSDGLVQLENDIREEVGDDQQLVAKELFIRGMRLNWSLQDYIREAYADLRSAIGYDPRYAEAWRDCVESIESAVAYRVADLEGIDVTDVTE